jgi:hypothetical protein
MAAPSEGDGDRRSQDLPFGVIPKHDRRRAARPHRLPQSVFDRARVVGSAGTSGRRVQAWTGPGCVEITRTPAGAPRLIRSSHGNWQRLSSWRAGQQAPPVMPGDSPPCRRPLELVVRGAHGPRNRGRTGHGITILPDVPGCPGLHSGSSGQCSRRTRKGRRTRAPAARHDEGIACSSRSRWAAWRGADRR